MAIGPEYAQYGYWGVAVAGLAAIVAIAIGTRTRKSTFELLCIIAIVIFSVTVAVATEFYRSNVEAQNDVTKSKIEQLSKENADLKARVEAASKTQAGSATVDRTKIVDVSNKFTAAIQLVRGAASNTSDAPRCSSVAYKAATDLITANNELLALVK